MWDYIDERKAQIAFSAYQHVSLVVQAVLLATVVAVVLAVVVTRIPRLEPVANTLSAVGLTVPSFALLGILV
ncbi:ABC transporter permease, partial [Rhodococcus ruber]|nr:ABC transporter permease [Rhodococcus ruber]